MPPSSSHSTGSISVSVSLALRRELVSRMSSSFKKMSKIWLRIRQRLIKRAADFGILLDDVAITHLNFSPEYEKALQ